MNARDKISKSAMNLISVAKDLTVANIMSQVSEGKITVDKVQLNKLVVLVGQSIDTGYHRAYPSFMKDVEDALSSVKEPSKKK